VTSFFKGDDDLEAAARAADAYVPLVDRELAAESAGKASSRAVLSP
jgi:hypothetical protein